MPDSLIINESPAPPSASTPKPRCARKATAQKPAKAVAPADSERPAPPIADIVVGETGRRSSSQQTFSPTRFFDEIAAMLKPLDDNSGAYKAGNEAALVAALKPMMGDFTIADACILAEPMWDLTWATGVPETTRDLGGTAYFLLRDFICCASAASPRDAGARVHFWREKKSALSAENAALIILTMSEDISDLISGDFSDGQLFGGDYASSEQNPAFEPQTWWVRRFEMLKRLNEQVQ